MACTISGGKVDGRMWRHRMRRTRVPLAIAEMAVGRRGGGSAVASVDSAIEAAGASRLWRIVGLLGIVIPFFGLSYYSIVAGWAIDYTGAAIGHGFAGLDADRSRDTFDLLAGSPIRGGLLQLAFIMGAATVVALGVQRGIETVSRIKMIALFVILIGLVIYNAATVGLGASAVFLLRPDFAALGAQGVLTALGQALFSTAIGSERKSGTQRPDAAIDSIRASAAGETTATHSPPSLAKFFWGAK